MKKGSLGTANVEDARRCWVRNDPCQPEPGMSITWRCQEVKVFFPETVIICIIVSWHGEGLLEGERMDYGELELLSMDVKQSQLMKWFIRGEE